VQCGAYRPARSNLNNHTSQVPDSRVVRLADKEWWVESDLDSFPAPGGGGLLDTSARVVWSAFQHASMFLGIRYEAGGATGNTFFDFFHQRSALAGVRFDF
jgi:hypothetical protein